MAPIGEYITKTANAMSDGWLVEEEQRDLGFPCLVRGFGCERFEPTRYSWEMQLTDTSIPHVHTGPQASLVAIVDGIAWFFHGLGKEVLRG